MQLGTKTNFYMIKVSTAKIDNDIYTLTHYFNTTECYDTVKQYNDLYWKTAPKTNSIENYQFGEDAKPWSLGPLLLNNGFENGYTILSINDKPWAFAGIRKHTDNIALALTRLFCFFTVKPISYGVILPFHLDIAKEYGYKKARVTFNEYNIHLYNTWIVKEFNRNKKNKRKNIMYESNDRIISTHKYLGEMMLNGTKQTVVEWDL